MTDSHLDCQSLYLRMSQAFVDNILADDSVVLRRIVRNIILANIMQRRVSGQMAIISADKRDVWLIDYVTRVRNCYLSQRTRWLSYRQGGSTAQLYRELSEMADQLGYWRNALIGDNVEDMVHDVYLQTIANPSAYPYDCTIDEWFRGLFRQALQAVIERIRARTISLDDEQFAETTGAGASIDFWEMDPSRWDDILELRHWLSQQPDLHQWVFKAFFNGLGAKQIADRFGINEGRVYRIVHKMRTQLRAYWYGGNNV